MWNKNLSAAIVIVIPAFDFRVGKKQEIAVKTNVVTPD